MKKYKYNRFIIGMIILLSILSFSSFSLGWQGRCKGVEYKKERKFTPQEREERINQIISRLTKRLNLTNQQGQTIREILLDSHQKIKAVWEEAKQKIKSIREETHQKIKSILTEEQRKKYEESKKESLEEIPLDK